MVNPSCPLDGITECDDDCLLCSSHEDKWAEVWEESAGPPSFHGQVYFLGGNLDEE
jgi:hypothetical protein